MKKITSVEQKKILTKMLKYIDQICRENDIKYSIISGTMLGAVRHNGFIPWDDDIDIILTHSNYEKLLNVLSRKNNFNYKLLTYDNTITYNYPFAKLVNQNTQLYEVGYNRINGYGVYIDIFEYNNTPKNNFLYKIHYDSIHFYKILIDLYCYNIPNCKSLKNIIKKIIKWIVQLYGINKLLNKYSTICRKYNSCKCDCVVSNWPSYSKNKERHLKENIKSYISTRFENIEVMMYSGYDDILKTMFGNYMELPPEDKRISNHNMLVYWKDDNNEK